MKLLCIAVLVGLMSAPVLAVNPSEVLKDPAMESRARDVSQYLRCLVCQNQSIDDSDAELARDLRLLVRQRIKAGDSNDQVIDYVVSRYGDFVLLKPPFKASTFLLWVGPALAFIAGVIAYLMYFRRRKLASASPQTAAPLSDEDKKRLEKLLNGQN
ncbi:MAG: cytochrome c-type biogenesis protein [Rhodospirillales bacterium]|jgi:cytochrome c-type biogenesis protein CcmH